MLIRSGNVCLCLVFPCEVAGKREVGVLPRDRRVDFSSNTTDAEMCCSRAETQLEALLISVSHRLCC
eukprot:5779400-Amphidinium_carterae.1